MVEENYTGETDRLYLLESDYEWFRMDADRNFEFEVTKEQAKSIREKLDSIDPKPFVCDESGCLNETSDIYKLPTEDSYEHLYLCEECSPDFEEPRNK